MNQLELFQEAKIEITPSLKNLAKTNPIECYDQLRASGMQIGLYLKFAQNDGFDTEEAFWKWFNQPFNGVVIHWTDFIYS